MQLTFRALQSNTPAVASQQSAEPRAVQSAGQGSHNSRLRELFRARTCRPARQTKGLRRVSRSSAPRGGLVRYPDKARFRHRPGRPVTRFLVQQAKGVDHFQHGGDTEIATDASRQQVSDGRFQLQAPIGDETRNLLSQILRDCGFREYGTHSRTNGSWHENEPDDTASALATFAKLCLDFGISDGRQARQCERVAEALALKGSRRLRERGGGRVDSKTERLCRGLADRVEFVLLAGNPGCQAQGRDARALWVVCRCRREGRGELRPSGDAQRNCSRMPWRVCSRAWINTPHSSIPANGNSSANRSRASSAGLASRLAWMPETGQAAGHRSHGGNPGVRGRRTGRRPDHGDRRNLDRGNEPG